MEKACTSIPRISCISLLRHFIALSLFVLFFLTAAILQPSSAQPLVIAKELVVAVPSDFSPYYQLDENKQIQGFAIDVFDALAARAGLRYRYQVYDTWADVIAAIKSGEARIIPLFGITDERSTYLDFTTPVMTFPINLFIRSSYKELKSSTDLKDHEIAVIKTNVVLPELESRENLKIQKFSNLEIAFYALISGQVDALAHAEPVTIQLANKIDLQDKIRALSPPLMEVKHALAVSRGHQDLKNQLEIALQAFLSTDEYKQIYRKWHENTDKSFWDVQKVFWSMAVLMVLVVMGFLLFRHKELVALNQTLQLQIDNATEQLSQSNAYLQDLTVTDALTGIYNRRAFENSLNELMIRAQRYQQNFSMLIFDIDDFKTLNDRYGHDMGDRVLIDVVERIIEIVRDVDILCRWGGEEFTILMPQTNKNGALKMAERCRRIIADELFDEVGEVTISIGVTCFASQDSERKFFKRADDALYQAKAEGKNLVIWNGDGC